MKRMIFTGVLALTAGLSSLLAQPAKVPAPKSKAEADAIAAMQNAQDPDGRIKAAEDLISKFADTDYKEYAYMTEAQAYQMKNDDVKAQVYAEQALAINPKQFVMEIMLGGLIAKGMKEHDLDRAEKMTKATKLFNDGIEHVKTAPKPNPQMADADWAAAQKYVMGDAYNGLGMLAQQDKKWDEAIKQYKLAWESDPDQDAFATRLAAAYLGGGKPQEAIEICDKLLAKPNLHPQIKQVVTNVKNQAAAVKK